MTRYFFHFVINDKPASDADGLELDDEQSARRQAASTLAAILAEEIQSDGPSLDAAVTVIDELDATIFEATMSYREKRG